MLLKNYLKIHIIVIINEIDFHAVKFCFLLDELVAEEKVDTRSEHQPGETNVIKKIIKEKNYGYNYLKNAVL